MRKIGIDRYLDPNIDDSEREVAKESPSSNVYEDAKDLYDFDYPTPEEFRQMNESLDRLRNQYELIRIDIEKSLEMLKVRLK